MHLQLLPDVSAKLLLRWLCSNGFALLDQRSHELDGHQEADLLAIQALGNVDSDHRTGAIDCGSAAHAGIDRTGEQNLRIVGTGDEPVERTFRDGKSEIERIADRVQAFALLQRFGADPKRGPPALLVDANQ